MLAQRAAGPGEYLDAALRHAALQADLTEPERGERCQRGGLDEDRVAGGQRGSDLPGGKHDREVPRDDRSDDPERLADGVVEGSGVGGEGLSEQLVDGPGVVPERPCRECDLVARLADRLTDIARLEQGERLRFGVDRVGDGEQDACALVERAPLPFPCRRCCLVDERVERVDGDGRHARDDVLDAGVEDVYCRGIDRDGHVAAPHAFTNASKRTVSVPSSGCHCTPSTERP